MKEVIRKLYLVFETFVSPLDVVAVLKMVKIHIRVDDVVDIRKLT